MGLTWGVAGNASPFSSGVIKVAVLVAYITGGIESRGWPGGPTRAFGEVGVLYDAFPPLPK